MQILRRSIHPHTHQWLWQLGLSALLGLVTFILLYGRFPLYWSHVNWIYAAGGDALMTQFGWEWFRSESWHFPLGQISGYGYPIGTSVAFMDAIPLIAIPLRLLSPLLGTDFQYLGLWALISLCGQILVGMLILNEFTSSHLLKILGALLLSLAPPLVFRMFYHSSLTAHWILLAAIWFIIVERRRTLWRGAWPVLFTLTTLIHAYFIFMLIPLWLVGLFFRYQKTSIKWNGLMDFLLVVAGVALAGYTIGLFNLAPDSLGGMGFGIFSWNLNGFFNPLHFSSAFIKELPTGTGGQYEGFSYLGLGNLMLLPVALYLFPQKELTRRRWGFILPLAAAALALTLMALTHEAYLGATPLWRVPLPDQILQLGAIFRSSGRFIWPVFYLVVLFSLITIIRNVRRPVVVLTAAILLQLLDLQPLYVMKHMSGFAGYEPAIVQSGFWIAAAETNDHLVLLPAKKLPLDFEPLAVYARQNRLTINLGFFARSDLTAIQSHGRQVWQDLLAGRPDSRTLYILITPEWADLARYYLDESLYICEVDGLTVMFSPENGLAAGDIVPAASCTIPDPSGTPAGSP
ncbi:MAG TPA: DUF6311 domain-containing protein [Anaerolineaceae bacterium]|nr:DUF6311 domain-containing protein [Anaerolineaceae bacterium]